MRPLPETVFRHLLLAHFAATCAMTGVIWVVQLVIYPQFSTLGAEVFPRYHAQYTGLVTLVVGPLMILEIVTATLIFLQRQLCPLSIIRRAFTRPRRKTSREGQGKVVGRSG
jgi:hypothetical protein